MVESQFQIISRKALSYDAAARRHQVADHWDVGKHSLRVVSDLSLGPNGVRVFDHSSTCIAAGAVQIGAFTDVKDSDTGQIYQLDRIDVDGFCLGYATNAPVRPRAQYMVVETARNPLKPVLPNGGFGPGTMIETAAGLEPVEWLETGVEVMTLDHGLQSIRHIVRCELGILAQDLVWLQAEELDQDCPVEPLYLSPKQRFLLRNPMAELYFGDSEILVQSHDWIPKDRARASPLQKGATLTVLVFDEPEMIRAENVWVNSFIPNVPNLSSLCAYVNAAVLVNLRSTQTAQKFPRPCVSAEEICLLRHKQESQTAYGVLSARQ